MSIVEGTIVNGHIEVDAHKLPAEGCKVAVYLPDERAVTPDEIEMINEAIDEADADPTGGVAWDEFRRTLRSGG